MSEKIRLERGMRRLADDELMHWKYIKRVRKPDGSYRYYYDVKSTTKGKLTYAKNMYEQNTKEARKYEDEYRKRSYDYKRTKDEQKKYEELANKWGHSRLVNDIESKRASQALSNYKKTLRSKIDDKIAVWSTKTAKVLTSNSSKINNAKNWLKDKLFPSNRYARKR